MRLIDADALKQTFCAECNHSIKCEDCDIDYHFEYLAPTVDAVEVVRCKDCRNCEERQTANYLPFLYCKTHEHSVLSNFYCSWGERREDADT